MIRIGISGWNYPPWRGTFYPKGLRQKSELHYASRQLASIEVNGTFYSLQRPESYAAWSAQTPPDFILSIKGPRFITHIRRLKEPRLPLANFFASGILQLGPKLGPILWQLPPSFRFNRVRLADFFSLLPRDSTSAARLARSHDRLPGRTWIGRVSNRPLRHALEVRHESFCCPEFIALLRQHDIALVVADTAGKWPFMEDVTSDFIYVRLHGDEQLYVSGYTPASLRDWARRIRAWARGRMPSGSRLAAPRESAAWLRTNPARRRDVFVYFDNDVKVRAPYDAMSLAHLLKLGSKPGRPPSAKSISELPRLSGDRRWPAYARRGIRFRKLKTK